MAGLEDFYTPFGFAALPPTVGAGGYGMPYMPPIPYRGPELHNAPPRPGDPVAGPISETLGPLGPFMPAAGRAAGPAGSYAKSMLGGAGLGSGAGALDYWAHGDDPREGAGVGAVFGTAAGRGSARRLRHAQATAVIGREAYGKSEVDFRRLSLAFGVCWAYQPGQLPRTARPLAGESPIASLEIGGMTFRTKGDATAFFMAMLGRYEPRDTINPQDARMLHALIERHPERDQKVDVGITGFMLTWQRWEQSASG